MTAPNTPSEIPGCIARRETDAVYAWFSTRRLQVVKGDVTLSLSADDLRALFNFVEGCVIEEQLS
ncbi:MAG: hypothetical protein A3H93_09085 [Rhodocyclales bacterium RIFCSPLOWO2_02_FULL_63_24]|nr:MAG: hypothetical protein A3H93_09085 [Rhodocyclales bacterium RIFCSPLOWO2_02_FULL_63_24]